MPKAQVTITREIIPDEHPDASYLEQEDMGFEYRLAAYRRGEFGFVGVRARAEIRTPYGQDWIVAHISSPGLWGIEDDSGEDYFNEVYEEEKQTLLGMLDDIKNFELVY